MNPPCRVMYPFCQGRSATIDSAVARILLLTRAPWKCHRNACSCSTTIRLGSTLAAATLALHYIVRVSLDRPYCFAYIHTHTCIRFDLPQRMRRVYALISQTRDKGACPSSHCFATDRGSAWRFRTESHVICTCTFVALCFASDIIITYASGLTGGVELNAELDSHNRHNVHGSLIKRCPSHRDVVNVLLVRPARAFHEYLNFCINFSYI
jgi:hypothetical protein